MSTITSLFANYGITGNATIDALILAHLIPILVSYVTTVFAFIQEFLTKVIMKKLQEWYYKIKRKFLGTVDFRLSVSQEKSIYIPIRNIFFSSTIKSDSIDAKTIGLLNLITESKYNTDATTNNHWYIDDMYDLTMDEANNINIEKKIDMGTSISKKYFEFNNYYIVVSENKKTDFSHYFKCYSGINKDKDDKDNSDNNKKESNNTEYFILFEAIRKSISMPKNDEIIKKFLYERFKLHMRIPYKYMIRIDNDVINTKLRQNDGEFIDDDNDTKELMISDGIEQFLLNPKVKQFYGHELDNGSIKINNSSGISSSLIAKYNGNVFNAENIANELSLTDIYDNTNDTEVKLFSPNFKSIFKYFFGDKSYSENHVSYFYFKNNKIVMYYAYNDRNDIIKRYIAIVSFQEIINKKHIIDIFSELNFEKKEVEKSKSSKMKIYTYVNGDWSYTKCKARTYDTIYLPIRMKKLITSEMDKFICFDKIFRENGIPYKKGFLFYGPPGTGKTSLVKALAYTYDIPIYIFDINNGSVNDENISKIINSISGKGNRILLFEDIDSAFSDKEELKCQIKNGDNGNNKKDNDNSSKKYLTYSGLLNALDGVTSGHDGTIMIMTTNYYEKLGQALIRPGRIDFCLELTFCDYDQIVEMTKNMITKSYKIIEEEIISDERKNILFSNPYNYDELIVEINKFATNLTNDQRKSTVKPCELQTYILRYIENVKDIFGLYEELIKK